MKAVGYRRRAAKSLRRLSPSAQADVQEALREYAETGRGDVKTLRGRDGARLRIGDYRAVFIETAELIDVVAVGHRRDIYR